MRTAFINTVMTCAEEDKNIWMLCGDLGYSVLEPFTKKFPNRFINVGVAEQNMIGVAAGLALTGRKVICYSIGNFATLRCLEQIRNDVCYHDADVKVVSIGGGLVYGAHGYTHHTVEDLAVMRALPNLTVIAPGDPTEAQLATSWMLQQKGPCYLRLGKAGEPKLYDKEPAFHFGKIIERQQGSDVLLISTGGIMELTLNVAKALQKDGLKIGIASCPFVKPLDAGYIAAQAQRYALIVTLEEHTASGGLNEAVASVMARTGSKARLLPVTVPELALKGISGNHGELLKRIGLTVETISQTIQHKLKGLAP
jgi:transketolase